MLFKMIDWIFGAEKEGVNIVPGRTMADVFKESDEKERINDLRMEELKKRNKVYRPKNFDEYIGQEKAKSILKSYIEALTKREKVFPHLLVYGKAGCGKTTLARIIANEFNTNISEVITSKIKSSDTLFNYFNEVKGGMVFLDEVHGIPRDLVEQIYTMMEDFICDDTCCEPFTLVGATTELGEILKDRKPFYDRFKIIIELEDYTVGELAKIVKQYKDNSFPEDDVDESVYNIVAKNCRATPRTGIRYLESAIYLDGNIEQVLKNFGIIEDGFTDRDLKTLEYIAQNEKGVGLQGLAAYLGVSEQNYSYQTEPFLLKNGLILRTPRGRKITDEGVKKIERLKK